MGEMKQYLEDIIKEKLSGEYEKKTSAYASRGNRIRMSDSEWAQGRNNAGEVETPLGSIPNAQTDNWMYAYFSTHISVIEEVLSKFAEKIDSISTTGGN